MNKIETSKEICEVERYDGKDAFKGKKGCDAKDVKKWIDNL